MANNIVATWGSNANSRNHLRIIRTMQSLMTLHPNTVLSHGKNPRFMQLPCGQSLLIWSWKTRLAVPRRKSLGRSVPNPTILLWRNIRAKPVIFRWLSTTS